MASAWTPVIEAVIFANRLRKRQRASSRNAENSRLLQNSSSRKSVEVTIPIESHLVDIETGIQTAHITEATEAAKTFPEAEAYLKATSKYIRSISELSFAAIFTLLSGNLEKQNGTKRKVLLHCLVALVGTFFCGTMSIILASRNQSKSFLLLLVKALHYITIILFTISGILGVLLLFLINFSGVDKET